MSVESGAEEPVPPALGAGRVRFGRAGLDACGRVAFTSTVFRGWLRAGAGGVTEAGGGCTITG